MTTDQQSKHQRFTRATVAALALALAGLLMPFLAPPARAAEPALAVDTLLDLPAATACTTAPDDCSLRGALINANADGITEIETITVPAGAYELTVPGGDAASGSLNVSASVVIEGAGAATTVIDANGLDRVLVVNGPGAAATRTLIASGLTFRGGRPCNEPGGDDGNNAGGGGLFIHGIAQLTDVIVEDNVTCGAGGGIEADSFGSALTLTRSIIRGNTAQGGAGGVHSLFSLAMVDSTVSGNLADRSPGGGLRLAGTATIDGSTISNNVATARGGGIITGDDTTSACCAATVVITNSTISGNVAHWWNSGTPQYFPGVGGGIQIGRSRFTLRHVTLTANAAETNPNYGAVGRGAGIASGYTSFLTLENSIVAGNFGNEDCLFDVDTTYAMTGSFGCSFGGIQNPELGPLAGNGGLTATHALATGNPAVNSADPALCGALDQRGLARPSGDGCDMGAYELQVAPPPPPPPPPPAGPANAVVVVTSTYDGDLEDPRDFRFDVSRAGTSLAAFDGSDLFGPTGPTSYVVGVDVSNFRGDAIRLTEATPPGWLAMFGGDCAADGSLTLRPDQVLTCEVTNIALDEFQPATTAAVVIETSFGTPPTADLRDFEIIPQLIGEPVFGFSAYDVQPSGKRTIGWAVPVDQVLGVGVLTHGPAGWLAILGADCAVGHFYAEVGKLTRCTVEWFEVDPAANAVVVVTSTYDGDLEDPRDFRFDVSRAGTSLAAFDGSDLFGPTGPTSYVVGVDVSNFRGDAIRLTEATPPGWLAMFGGDCAADGSLTLRPDQVLTCEVTNIALDEFQPATTAAVVIETSFGTPPTADLRDFEIIPQLIGEPVFGFSAYDVQPSGKRTIGWAVPVDQVLGVGVLTHGPAGWLAILGADCAVGHFYAEVGKLTRCTVEWFEVDPAANAVVVVTSTYDGDLEDPRDFRFDVSRAGTSLAAFDGSDLFGPTGPTSYVVGVDVSNFRGDAIRLTEATPPGWLAMFGGDCAADGSLTLRPDQVLTCEVTNIALDEFQPATTAAVVIETSFGTPPTADLRDFEITPQLIGEPVFGFSAYDVQPSGKRTIGWAVPVDQVLGVGVLTHGPAGWLAILGADCAVGHFYAEVGKLTRCTVEWFEVGIPSDPTVDLVIADCSAAALATVTQVTGNLVVTDATCPELSLPNLTSIGGDLVIANNASLTDLSLPNLGSIAGDLAITGNASLLDIDLSALAFVGGNLTVTQNNAVDELATAATSVGGDIDVSQNATLIVFDMPDVESVGGDLDVSNNPLLTEMSAPTVTTIGGDLDASNNASMTMVSAPSVTTIGGDLDVSNNPLLTEMSVPTVTTIGGDLDASNNASMTMVSAPSVTTIGGDLDVSNNPLLTEMSVPTVTTIGGDMDVSGNAALAGGPGLVLHLPALISVGGSIVISDNVHLVTVETASMIDIGGDMTLTGNPTLTTFDAPSVETVGGDMTLSDNPTLTTFDAPSFETVEGDMTLELQLATIELATVSVGGNATIVGFATESLVAETALGATSFQLRNGLASLGTTLPQGAFATNVAFSVDRLTGSDLEPSGSIDPLAAYRLDFDVPTLGVDATIVFTIDLDAMAPADQQSFLDALASGRATLAVRADGATTYETLDVCASGQTPAADGCVSVHTNGSIVTFDGVAGHFSTWAVVVTAAPDAVAPVVTVPVDKQLEATGPTGRSVVYVAEVSALDDHDGIVATACLPASGSTFPIGTTTVTCRATDAAGNTGSATFRITIVDTTRPTVTVPATLTVPATGPAGAAVAFSASATDLVSGSLPPTCTPASGVTFPIGQTTVTCRATDAAGNVGSATFLVRVLAAVDQLTSLRNDVAVAAPPLTPTLVNDLRTKLDDAISKLGQRKVTDSCKKIQDFISKVEQERAKRTIPAALADSWLARARQIRTVMGC